MDELFVSSRAQEAGGAKPLTGQSLTEGLPVQRVDDNMLGQVQLQLLLARCTQEEGAALPASSVACCRN